MYQKPNNFSPKIFFRAPNVKGRTQTQLFYPQNNGRIRSEMDPPLYKYVHLCVFKGLTYDNPASLPYR